MIYLTDFGAVHMFLISTMKVNSFYYDMKVKVLGTHAIKLSSGVKLTERSTGLVDNKPPTVNRNILQTPRVLYEFCSCFLF